MTDSRNSTFSAQEIHTSTIGDVFFLGIVVLLSSVLYVWDLGFYSDDWSMLKKFEFSGDRSLFGLVHTLFPGMWPRPVAAACVAMLYWLFGLEPLGYHLVNTVVLTSGIVLFHYVLRELRQNRWLALAVPMVYSLLPHYSTDRFWYSAGLLANLSMALYFLSLYSDLRMVTSRARCLWRWNVAGLASLLVSTLAYEVFIPLFLLNPLVVLYRRWRSERSTSGSQVRWGTLIVLMAGNVLALVLVVFFKNMTSSRAETTSTKHLLTSMSGIISLIKSFIASAIALNYGDYGVLLPNNIGTILWNYPNPAVWISTGALGLIILLYLLYQLAHQSKVELPTRRSMLKAIGLGLLVTGVSYTLFFAVNSRYFLTATSIGNRVAIAAGVGVASSAVGLFGWLSNLAHSSNSRKGMFCLLITLACCCGFLINNTIASFWVVAHRQQQVIIADMRHQMPTLPGKSTLLLDGFCSYVGPGIVFETDWDVSGVLAVAYRDRSLKGDVVKPNLKIGEEQITLGMGKRYPYEQLYVYHVRQKKLFRLADAETAHAYFSEFNPDYSNGCPDGYPYQGVPIFSEFLPLAVQSMKTLQSQADRVFEMLSLGRP